MNDSRNEELLARYASRKLSAEEERELMALAYEDQGVFEAVLQEHTLRELLSDTETRGLLLEAAAPESGPFQRLRSWLTVPRIAWAAGAVAIAAVAVVMVTTDSSRPPFEPASKPPSTRDASETVLQGEARAAFLRYIGSVIESTPDLTIAFPSGRDVPMDGQIGVEVSSKAASSLLLVESAAGEPDRVILPSADQNARVAAGEVVRIPTARYRVQGLPGPRRLTLVAFPPGTDVAAWLRGQAPWTEPLGARVESFNVLPR